jgi:predicted permease
MMGMLRDLHQALRNLAHRPLLLLLAVLPLGLSIAALSTLFAVAQSTLVGTMPGIDPGRGTLVEIGREARLDSLSWPDLQGLARESRSLEAVYGWHLLPVNARTEDARGTTRGLGILVSGRYFEALGVRAGHGRLLGAADDVVDDTAPRVVLSHVAFTRLLGGDPRRLGEPLVINGHAYAVVGVTEPAFRGHIAVLEPDFYIPLTLQPLAQPSNGAELLVSPEASWLSVGGRLREGVDPATAAAELAAISARLEGLRRADGRHETLGMAPLRALPAELVGPLAGFTALLAVLVGLVLLVACSNVAGWLLARGESRLPELGVRVALGASRGRILRLLLAESALVAAGAALLAVAGARALLSLLPAIDLPAPFPLRFEVPLDGAVVVFAAATALLTLLVAGLVPALRVAAAARAAGTGVRATRRSRAREGLVVAQVAFTAFLLVGAGLFAHSLVKSQQVAIGFEPRGLLNADLDLEPSGYAEDRQQAVLSAVLARVRELPGVADAALARVVPLTLNQMSYGVVVDDAPPERMLSPSMNIVSPDYFRTLRIPLQGREFNDADRAGADGVVVVNRVLAERLFGGADALGRTFRYGSPDSPRTLRVVGVAGEGRHASWHEAPEPFLWLPLAQWPAAQLNLLVRSDLPQDAVARAITGAVAAVDPELPLPQVHAMTDTIALSILPQRIAALAATALGALGLLLASLGLYGLLAQFVASRTREIGVRLSLGATPRRVAGDVAWRGARLALFGLLLGLCGASALAVAAESILFGVDAGDAWPFVAAALAILACIALACVGPARRAAATLPAEALRQD